MSKIYTTRLQPLWYKGPSKHSTKIPIWSRIKTEVAPGTSVPPDFLPDIQEDTWICSDEICDIRGIQLDSKAQWLACGSILKERVEKVMPYDGKAIIASPCDKPVQCPGTEWVFNWDASGWIMKQKRPPPTKPKGENSLSTKARQKADSPAQPITSSKTRSGEGSSIQDPTAKDLEGQETKAILKDIFESCAN